MENYTDLMTRMSVQAPGCADNVMMMAIQDAASDFCRETEALTGTSIQNAVKEATEYTIVITEEAQLFRVISFKLNGITQHPAHYAVNPAKNMITLAHPAQKDAENGIEIVYVMLPLKEAKSLNEGFMNRWGDGIMAKALAELMLQPKKPWSDPDRAKFHMDKYRQYRSEAVKERMAEYQGVDYRVSMRPGRFF